MCIISIFNFSGIHLFCFKYVPARTYTRKYILPSGKNSYNLPRRFLFLIALFFFCMLSNSWLIVFNFLLYCLGIWIGLMTLPPRTIKVGRVILACASLVFHSGPIGFLKLLSYWSRLSYWWGNLLCIKKKLWVKNYIKIWRERYIG